MLRQSTPQTLLLLCCFAAAPSCNTDDGSPNSGQETAAGGSNTTQSGGSTATTGGSNPGSGGSASGASGTASGGAVVNGTGGLANAGSSSGGSGGANGGVGTSNGGASPIAGSATGGVPSAGGVTGGSANGGSATGGAPKGGSSSSGAGNATGGASNPSSGGAATGGNSAKGGATTGGTSSAGAGGTLATGGTGGSTSGTGGGPWTFPAGVTKPKLMIVGDSISAGPGCYKKYLLKNLTDNHYSNFEFVGQYTDDCGGGVRHSAVSCSTAEQFTQASFTMQNCSQGTSFPGMSTLMNTHKPDLVMLQLGVNDVWGGRATDAILGSYATLVQQARAQNSNVVIVVAKINKIRPDCSTSDAVTKRAETLVNAVPAWAAAQSSAKSPVFVADLWTNSDWSKTETIDCVHPNDVGAQRMGLNWYNALKGILKPN